MSNKNRILELGKYLFYNTDLNHSVSTNDLLLMLEANGVSANRKTLKDDLDTLIEMGADICIDRSQSNHYYWGKKIFTKRQTQILQSAISTAKYITEKERAELIKQVLVFSEISLSGEAVEHLFANQSQCFDNPDLYNHIESINTAINKGQKIAFTFFDFSNTKRRMLRNGGQQTIMNPYGMLWNGKHYYVVGYCQTHNKVETYCIERMKDIAFLEGGKAPEKSCFNNFSKQAFTLFGGEATDFVLYAHQSMMTHFIAQFGMSFKVEPVGEEYFRAYVLAAKSPQFYSWVFQFAGQIEIIAPQAAREEFVQMCRQNLQTI